MKKTLVIIAEPELANSGTHQFLLQSGQALTTADYLDLSMLYNQGQTINPQVELTRWSQYQRIILQFNLYWYQAPAILSDYLQTIWGEESQLVHWQQALEHKELGLVISAGVKAEHYQLGGAVGRTVSELASPYAAMAHYFGMTLLEIFPIHQFHYLSQEQKMHLMWEYACYCDTGNASSFRQLQSYLLTHLEALDFDQLPLNETEQLIFDQLLATMELQADEIEQLTDWEQGEW